MLYVQAKFYGELDPSFASTPKYIREYTVKLNQFPQNCLKRI